MASDFNKMVYKEVERHVKAQVGDRPFTTKEWRALMDVVMGQFAKSLISIVATVANSQAAAAAQAAAKAADAKATAETPVPVTTAHLDPADFPVETQSVLTPIAADPSVA